MFQFSRREVSLLSLGLLTGTRTSAETNDRWEFYHGANPPEHLPPTVVDGVVYVVAGDTLHALEVESGESVWEFENIGRELGRQVAVVDGYCFVTDEEGAIVILEADTGERYDILEIDPEGDDPERVGAPVVYRGLVFVQTDQELVALDYLNGERVWATVHGRSPTFRNPDAAIPAIEDGIVVAFSAEDEPVLAFDYLTGERQWSYRSALSSRVSSPVVNTGSVYIARPRGTLASVDLASGEEEWEYEASFGREQTLPVVSDDTVVMTGSRVYPDEFISEGYIEAVDIGGANPTRKWGARMRGAGNRGAGTITDEYFIIGTQNGIRVFDLADGDHWQIYEGLSYNRVYDHLTLVDGGLVANEQQVLGLAPEFLQGVTGKRGSYTASGHHDGWAERAARSVAALDLTVSEAQPTVGEDVTVEVTVHLENGIEADVTDPATVSVQESGARVGECGTITFEESGTVTLEAAYDDSTTTTTLEVQDEEDADTEADEDGMPSAGVLTVATSLGATAYLLDRRRSE